MLASFFPLLGAPPGHQEHADVLRNGTNALLQCKTIAVQLDHAAVCHLDGDLVARERLRDRVDEQTYFKSRLIGEELDMSAKEVGTNMPAIREGDVDVDVEKWGYSSSTTWKVTA